MLKVKQEELKMRGDTIVEVLISLAILGLAFGISFATANRSLLMARNAEEHGEALQYLNSQVELVRANSNLATLYTDTNPAPAPSIPFCMDSTQANPVVASSSAACKVGTEGIYQESDTYTPAVSNGSNQDIFSFTVKWPGVGNLGPQQEQLYYKVHPL